jgi:hypothetical protein
MPNHDHQGRYAAQRIERGEFYPLLMFSSVGAMMLASAGDLLSLFIGLETMSLGVYAMTGFRRGSRRSTEAAMKYFLLGSFAAAVLLYGGALLYGATGHTDLAGIGGRQQREEQGPGAAGPDRTDADERSATGRDAWARIHRGRSQRQGPTETRRRKTSESLGASRPLRR